jgi:hypothetical protein
MDFRWRYSVYEAPAVTECQRLFLVQARSDFAIFQFLREQSELPACHSLHYLQMATEKLGKAYLAKRGPPALSHRGFSRFLKRLSTDRKAQRQMRYQGSNANWEHTIRKCREYGDLVERLAPAHAANGPNSEYPWPPANPQHAPVEFDFPIWKELEETASGRQFLNLTQRLFEVADEFL